MARLLPEPDDDLLELPQGSLADDDAVGVEDAEELLFQELDVGGEEIGLDTESAGASDAFGSLLVDEVDDAEDDPLDDSTLAIEADIDSDEDEQDWLEESDGAADGEWDDALPDELGEEGGDDGGEEGVDDPLLDGLPEDPQRVRRQDEEDDAEGFEDDGLDDFARELGNEA